MLYVFIVTSGDMIQLDMNFAVKKVLELKKEISRLTGFLEDDLILLCSGGEELLSENMVGNYHGAGTDTNPIYLFCKYKPSREILLSPEYKLDPTIADDVMACSNMAPSMAALSVRRTLAQRFAECALKGKKECNTLVLHQHLQQQGWAVVIANLEDAKDVLLKRKQHFDEIFQKYLDNRSSYREIINGFPNDLALLSKLPLLDKLIVSECSEDSVATQHTLLSWFCTEPFEVLESLVEKLHRSLDELDESTWKKVDSDLKQVLKNTEVKDLKELKGIEDRLTELGKRKLQAENIEKDQSELCKGFMNQAQFQHATDPYVLPDICKTFQNQLELMLHNHKCLDDILSKCNIAKTQLCDKINLHVKIISQVENEMYEQQMNIIFFEKHVKSLESKVESFRQVHMAPERYLKTLAEVCRRKEFSASYMKWANELSSQVCKLYNKELSMRQEFTDKDKKNMVDNLFPGMDDEPPSYAVECPKPFDQNLADITKEDLEWLKTQFPELSGFCEVFPTEAMPLICTESDSAFSSNIPSSLKINSVGHSHSNILKVHAKLSALQKLVDEVHSIRSSLMAMKIYVEDEMSAKMSVSSDVVEKIGTCAEEIQKQIIAEKEASVADAKIEFKSIENAYISRLEVESQKLHDAEQQISCYEDRLREVTSHLEDVKHEKVELVVKLEEKDEIIKKMILEHELELDLLKKDTESDLKKKESAVFKLQEELNEAKYEVEKLRTEIALRPNLDVKINEYKEEVRLLQDKLRLHEKQLNSLLFQRSTFKGLEQSDLKFEETDDMLVKVEKLSTLWKFAENTIDSLQAKLLESKKTEEELLKKSEDQNCEIELLRSKYQEAVDTALREKAKTERENMEKTLESNQEQKSLELLQQTHEEEMEKLKSRITAENQVSFNEAINRLSKEKDSTIDDLKSQIKKLDAALTGIRCCFDNFLLSVKSSVMTHSDFGAASSKESLSIEHQLIKLKKDLEPLFKYPPARSPSIQSIQQSLESIKKKFKAKEMEYQRMISIYINQPNLDCSQCCTKLSILTCDKNDLILLCYDEKYRNFIVFHLGPFVHFLHTDSMQAMNLKIPALPSDSAGPSSSAQSSTQTCPKSLEPSQRWAIGVVEDKEFCITKKKGNRYNVPVGTKFHRVKVRPWDREAGAAVHHCHRSFQMGASSSTAAVSKSISVQSPSDDGSTSSKDMSASSI